MITDRYFANPHFRAYGRLLHDLHRLIRDGADESEEGETLRSRMDEPSEFLTQDEVTCLSGVSADFFTLAGQPSTYRAEPLSAEVREDLKRSMAARDSGDFATALELLRKNDAGINPAILAYFRGRIWATAGEHEIAVNFFDRARALDPDNVGYTFLWLDTLSRVDFPAALRTAQDLLRDPSQHPPQLVLKAADIAFASTRESSEVPAAETIRKLIPIFEDVVVRLEEAATWDVIQRADAAR